MATDILNAKHAHLIGVGGIGLSALAQLLKLRGIDVSGCDRDTSPVTALLESVGIQCYPAHGAEHIAKGVDLVIYSDAIPEDNPERRRARESHIPELSYFEALGRIVNTAPYLIAVAGAHGKTTTTAMLTDVLEAGGLDPTAVIGSLRAKTRSNFRAGAGKYVVVEADEYRRHFLAFQPKLLVITNIDNDHLDYFTDLADIQSAFRECSKKVPADGFVVCNAADEKLKPILDGLSCTVVDYLNYFDAHLPMKVLPLNRINAAAVLAVADILKIDSTVARQALAEFSGTWRRFEYKGTTSGGALVYDDYAHHPAEIIATLASVRKQFPDRRIIVAFHPHLYSRTKLLFNDFVEAFEVADEVVVAPIFAARETPDPTVSSEALAKQIASRGASARALPSLEAVADYLPLHTHAGDLIITMGAGDIYKVAEQLTKS